MDSDGACHSARILPTYYYRGDSPIRGAEFLVGSDVCQHGSILERPESAKHHYARTTPGLCEVRGGNPSGLLHSAPGESHMPG